MYRIIAPAFAALASLGIADLALACGSGKVNYADTFDTFSSDWGKQGDVMKLKSGELTFTQVDGKSFSVFALPEFRNIDFCVNLKVTESTAHGESYGGIMFWTRDIDHFYGFQITPDGYATVFQYDEDFMTLIDDRAFSAIKQGINAVNELRVVTRGPNATFYVNNQKFDTLNVKTAPGTSHIGLTIDAPLDKGKAAFAFDNVQVRSVTN